MNTITNKVFFQENANNRNFCQAKVYQFKQDAEKENIPWWWISTV